MCAAGAQVLGSPLLGGSAPWSEKSLNVMGAPPPNAPLWELLDSAAKQVNQQERAPVTCEG